MTPARVYHHPDRSDIAMPKVLFALSEPLRLSMVRMLAERGEVDSIELGPDLPRSTLTHHTGLLRESGVVRVRAEGRKCMIRLRDEDLEARFPGLIDTVLSGYADDADDADADSADHADDARAGEAQGDNA